MYTVLQYITDVEWYAMVHHGIVLYITIYTLYYSMLRFRYGVIRYIMAWNCTSRYIYCTTVYYDCGTVRYGTERYGTVRCGAVHHGIVLFITVYTILQYITDAAWYCTVHHGIVRYITTLV
jgi:hypothetical protein